MTLQNLLSELQAVRLHPMADVNIESVAVIGGAVVAECEFNELEAVKDELASATDEIRDLEKQIKASDAEIEELTALADCAPEDPPTAQEMKALREVCNQWAVEVQEMRAEVTALRKRRGITAGFFSQQRQILDLLAGITDYQFTANHKQRAEQILNHIHSH